MRTSIITGRPHTISKKSPFRVLKQIFFNDMQRYQITPDDFLHIKTLDHLSGLIAFVIDFSAFFVETDHFLFTFVSR